MADLETTALEGIAGENGAAVNQVWELAVRPGVQSHHSGVLSPVRHARDAEAPVFLQDPSALGEHDGDPVLGKKLQGEAHEHECS